MHSHTSHSTGEQVVHPDRPMAGKAGSPESESLKSVLRQTSQADDLRFTSIEFSEKVDRDWGLVRLKLKDRKCSAAHEKQIAVRYGRRVLPKLNHRITVVEIGRASTRYDRSDPDMKTVSRHHARPPQAATDLAKKLRGYVPPRRPLHNRSSAATDTRARSESSCAVRSSIS